MLLSAPGQGTVGLGPPLGIREPVGGWAACQGSLAAGGPQPQFQALPPALCYPGTRMWPSTHPQGWFLTPASFQGSVGQKHAGSWQQLWGWWVLLRCQSPPAMWEGIELGASSSHPSSSRSLSNYHVAPPGVAVCQVIPAPAHVCTHGHACGSASMELPVGSAPEHMHTSGTDPAVPALAALALHMTRRFGSPRSLQMKVGGHGSVAGLAEPAPAAACLAGVVKVVQAHGGQCEAKCHVPMSPQPQCNPRLWSILCPVPMPGGVDVFLAAQSCQGSRWQVWSCSAFRGPFIRLPVAPLDIWMLPQPMQGMKMLVARVLLRPP